MDPKTTGEHYDRIANWWKDLDNPEYGVAQLLHAIEFSKKTGYALDVGCGSQGRFIENLLNHGFEVEGMDISSEMIALAQDRHPQVIFHIADICTWEFPRKYDFISAWDSTFHLPLDMHEAVLKKLCEGLAPEGTLLFTCGGGDERSEISGSFAGEKFEYSSLGVAEFLKILEESKCSCIHQEYDQPGENHVYIVARRT